MKIVTAAEMRDIDRATSERFAVPSLTLMENAGAAVSEFALSAYQSAKSFGVVCGKGNNGGDGFVVARKLYAASKEVRLLLLADPGELHGDAVANYERLPVKPVFAKSPSELESDTARTVLESEVLIDAILGTGFRPPVSGLYAQAIEKINASSSPVITVDIPSGADADVMGDQTGAVVRTDAIISFTAPRPAHVFGNLTSGPTIIAPIGSPEDAIQSSLNLNLITTKDIASLLQPRPRNSNKGMYGHVLVIGGSLGKAGAAAMAGFSALRTGAGLVTVATARGVLGTVASYHPELMTEPLAETDASSIALSALEEIKSIAEHKTVLAIGPGISRHPETAELVRNLVRDSKTPIVLDADGLNAFEGKTSELNRRDRILVLTPHPGEMSRLAGVSTAAVQRDRITVARTFAKEHELILVLKGDRTIVAKPDGEAWVNPTGNPGMATGGTGDILTGIVAGMLAQNPQHAFRAVIAAVYLHGLAGDVAVESLGEPSLVATDLVSELPEAFRRVRAEAGQKWTVIGV